MVSTHGAKHTGKSTPELKNNTGSPVVYLNESNSWIARAEDNKLGSAGWPPVSDEEFGIIPKPELDITPKQTKTLALTSKLSTLSQVPVATDRETSRLEMAYRLAPVAMEYRAIATHAKVGKCLATTSDEVRSRLISIRVAASDRLAAIHARVSGDPAALEIIDRAIAAEDRMASEGNSAIQLRDAWPW